MKLAWICYSSEEDKEPTIVFIEPNRIKYFEYFKIVCIVYSEVIR